MIFSSGATDPYPKYVQTGMKFSDDYSTISVNNYNLKDGGPFFTINLDTSGVFNKLYNSDPPDSDFKSRMKNNWQNGYLLAPTPTLAEKPFTLKQ